MEPLRRDRRSSNPSEKPALRRPTAPTFYVASSFRNIVNVRYVAQILESMGYVNTYDWTQNASARDARTVTLGDLRSIGQHERDAVIGADVVVVLLPGGKGTHVEFGIAIAKAEGPSCIRRTEPSTTLSMLSIQLFVEGDRLGALNLFGVGPDTFDVGPDRLVVAAHAAVAFADSQKTSARRKGS